MSYQSSHHFCEFSGGGDIYIIKPSPLVFQSAVQAGGGSAEQSPVSPIGDEINKMPSLTIEGKRGTVSSIKDVAHQLWANMLVVCVQMFVDRCKPDGHLKKFMKDELIGLKVLTGYGVACIGDGSVAAYKLEITFNGAMSIINKLPASTHDRPKAARLIDRVLEY